MPTKEEILEVLKNVIDPELRINIVDLGLVYGVEVKGEEVFIEATLTSPMCPLGPVIEQDIKREVNGMEGVKETHVRIVWDPPWDLSKMSDEAKLTLGYDI